MIHVMGFAFKICVYNSGKLGRYLKMSEDAIDQVKHCLKTILPKQEFYQWSPCSNACATHEMVCDSGIAVISNALSVIYPNTKVETDMSELACWERRERYARQCLESAKANLTTVARSKIILEAINA
jgi:hypothetical protein